MLKKIEYSTEEQRQEILDSKKDSFFVEEQLLFTGNYLVFSDTKPEEPIIYVNVPQEEFYELKKENALLKAQSQANSERSDFHEELIADMAMMIYR